MEFVPEEGAVWRPLAEPEALLVAGDEELDVDEVAVVDGAHLRRRAEELHRRREEPAVGEEGGDGEQYPRGGVSEHLGAVGDCLVGVLELSGAVGYSSLELFFTQVPLLRRSVAASPRERRQGTERRSGNLVKAHAIVPDKESPVGEEGKSEY